MNKFLSLLAAGMILSSSVVSAANFNGFGVGLSTGWTHNKSKVKTEQKTGNVITADFTKTNSKNALPVDLFINYLHSQADGFLWGLEASIGYDFGSQTKFKNSAGNVYYKIKKGYTVFLTPKFGWNFQDCWTLYGLVGFGGTNFKSTGYFNLTDQSKNASNFHFAIAPGFGTEVAVTDSVKVGFEYKYVRYATKKEKVTFNAQSTKADVTPSAHDFRVRATFTF